MPGSTKLVVMAMLLLLSGCFNTDDSVNVRWGDVSVGQQLMDLKHALDEGAVTAAEYESTKAALLSLAELCNNTQQDES